MALAAGTRLGRYEVRSQIGKGGMGEVYLARDPKLSRNLAIKLMPAMVLGDPERLRRFEQEARATGALNHPNILVVYDVGSYDGLPYVAFELLDGETLREQLAGAPLLQRTVIDYAIQIAHGLAAAHSKGVIHRDLKPENLFITNEGRVKILDFGLAKLIEPTDAEDVRTDLPTRKLDTDPATVVGTVGYMSPEQVRGQRVDQRSDIFSLGAVFYEMLSGKRAFRGDSSVETLNAILKEDPPPLYCTNTNVSPALDRLVRHCLEKSPEQRFQSARDLAFDLETFLRQSDSDSSQSPQYHNWMPRRRHIAWIATGVLLLASLAFLFSYLRHPRAEIKPIRFSIAMPEKTSFAGFASVSPDGRRIALRASDAGGQAMYFVRQLDSEEARPVPGTEGAAFCFWSPDSRFLGFAVQGKMLKTDLSGAPPKTVSAMTPGTFSGGATWGRDGVILFSDRRAIFRLSDSGGEPSMVREPNNSGGQKALLFPSFLPDGRHFLYLAISTQLGNDGAYVGSLDSPESKRLMNADMAPVYAYPGYLLFVRGETLLAQSFDTTKFELSDDPIEIVRHVTTGVAYSYAPYSVSENGVLVYQSRSPLETQLVWLDRSGRELRRVGSAGVISEPILSPDQKWVAFPRRDTQFKRDIWLLNLESGATFRLTSGDEDNTEPIWSPDGKTIVFDKRLGLGAASLYEKAANGTGEERLLVESSDLTFAEDWSTDGRYILYTNHNAKTQWDVWVLPTFGSRKPTPYIQTQFTELQGVFSPDGRWVAYTSNASGRPEVYIQSFPATEFKLQISNDGGGDPCWSRDGKELFYIALNQKLMSVRVNGNSTALTANVPQVLFDTDVVPLRDMRNHYDVASDGRFLFAVPTQKSSSSTVNVVVDWFANVKP